MKRQTTCYICKKTWTPEEGQWQNFMDFCGVDRKLMLEQFERQMLRKLLRPSILKIEDHPHK